MTLLLTMIGKVKMIIETGSTETHKALASQSQLFDSENEAQREDYFYSDTSLYSI